MAKPWPDDDRHRIEACDEKTFTQTFQMLKLNSKEFFFFPHGWVPPRRGPNSVSFR
jgi:hypothetical protein